jgi:hypothetical protein
VDLIPMTAALKTAAMDTITALDSTPTYARVDLVRADDGELLLIEVELIEPELWFDLAPDAAARLAAAVSPG